MMARTWREASTLIIATKSKSGKTLDLLPRSDILRLTEEHLEYQNFKLLMLKRSKTMGFMANAYVFPGGLVDKADFSNKWWDVFSKRTSVNDIKLLTERLVAATPAIFQTSQYKWIDPDIENGVKVGRYLPPELALRLTAIRETFEECGVLIARPNKVPTESPPQVQLVKNTAQWQERVQKDASQMMTLCLELDCSPDVWALRPWSNWLTPAFIKQRFNSIFYICTLNERPDVCYSSEVSNHLWNTPLQHLTMIGQGEIFLPPPQIYELSRLLNFETLESVEEFSKDRANKPMRMLFPIKANVADGFLHIMSGDQLYPSEPDVLGRSPTLEFDGTIEELEKSSTIINRMTFSHKSEWSMKCNVELDGHKRPINLQGKIIFPNL